MRLAEKGMVGEPLIRHLRTNYYAKLQNFSSVLSGLGADGSLILDGGWDVQKYCG